jgi:hypothetical protein
MASLQWLPPAGEDKTMRTHKTAVVSEPERCAAERRDGAPCQRPAANSFGFCRQHKWLLNFTNVITVPDHVMAQFEPGKSGFLFDGQTGHVYFLNKTSAFVFERLMRRATLLDIVNDLVRAYDVTQSTALSDTLDLLYQLRDFGLGTPVDAS